MMLFVVSCAMLFSSDFPSFFSFARNSHIFISSVFYLIYFCFLLLVLTLFTSSFFFFVWNIKSSQQQNSRKMRTHLNFHHEFSFNFFFFSSPSSQPPRLYFIPNRHWFQSHSTKSRSVGDRRN